MEHEKSIPMPARENHMERYRFDTMEVGDSVLVEGVSSTPAGSRAYGAALAYGRYHGKKFSGRKVERKPGEPFQIRIWRTA